MADLDFYYLQDSYKDVIVEGFFHIPEKVIRGVKDYYLENYEKYIRNQGGIVSRQLYPPKLFRLDFSDTKFEFLNKFDPKIMVYFKPRGASFYWDLNHAKTNTMQESLQGNVFLTFDQTVSHMLFQEIEHEVMHYVQSLINHTKGIEKAGTTNPKLSRKGIDYVGYKIGGTMRRRVTHSHRPVESYTDLLTSIRQIFYLYNKKIKNKPNYETLKNAVLYKKHFFMSFLNLVNDTENKKFEDYVSIKTFRDFKKISPKFYRHILKIAYDAFVNGESNFNEKEIEDKVNHFKDIRKQLSSKNEDQKINDLNKRRQDIQSGNLPLNFRRDYLLINSNEYEEIFGRVPSHIIDNYDNWSSTGFNLLKHVGANVLENDEQENVLLPDGLGEMIQLFKNLKKYKIESMKQESDIFGETNIENIEFIFNRVFAFLKQMYIEAIDIKSEDKSEYRDIQEKLNREIDKAYME